MKLKTVVVIFFGAVLTSNIQAQELDQLSQEDQKLTAFVGAKNAPIYQISFETHKQVIDLLILQLNNSVNVISKNIAQFNENPVLNENLLQTLLKDLETARQFIDSIYLQKYAYDFHYGTYYRIYQSFLKEEASRLTPEYIENVQSLIQQLEKNNSDYNKQFEKQTAHLETLKNHIAQDYMNLGEIARNLTSSGLKDVASHTSH